MDMSTRNVSSSDAARLGNSHTPLDLDQTSDQILDRVLDQILDQILGHTNFGSDQILDHH